MTGYKGNVFHFRNKDYRYVIGIECDVRVSRERFRYLFKKIKNLSLLQIDIHRDVI